MIEMVHGVHYIKGGMYGLAQGLLQLGQEIDWKDPNMVEKAKDVIYNKLETIEALKDIRQDVVSETVFTPLDFESRYNAKFGSAFGLMPTLTQSNYYRPQMYQEIIKTYTLQGQVRTLVQVCQLCDEC